MPPITSRHTAEKPEDEIASATGPRESNVITISDPKRDQGHDGPRQGTYREQVAQNRENPVQASGLYHSITTSAPAVSATLPAILPPLRGGGRSGRSGAGHCQAVPTAGEWQMAFSRARTPSAESTTTPPAGAGRRLRLFVARRDRIP